MPGLNTGQRIIYGNLGLQEGDVLINDYLLFSGRHTLRRVIEHQPMSLHFPRATFTTPEGYFLIPDDHGGYITFNSLEELALSLTTTFPLDLNDDDLVDFLIQHGMPPRELSFNLGGTQTGQQHQHTCQL